MKYTRVERPKNFSPLGSDYKRFVALQESKRIKRIPEAGATVTKENPEVKRLQERMESSLGDTKPKAYKSETKRKTVKINTAPAGKSEEKQKASEIPKKPKERMVHVYEKAGKPSGWQKREAGNVQTSEAQLESRKKMMKRMKIAGKR